jgi:hypothetical protein
VIWDELRDTRRVESVAMEAHGLPGSLPVCIWSPVHQTIPFSRMKCLPYLDLTEKTGCETYAIGLLDYQLYADSRKLHRPFAIHFKATPYAATLGRGFLCLRFFMDGYGIRFFRVAVFSAKDSDHGRRCRTAGLWRGQG